MSCHLVTASSRFIGRPHRDLCSRASPHTKDLLCHSRSDDCRSCPDGGSEQRRRLTTRPGVSMHTQTQRDIITTIFSIFKNGLPLRTGHTTCAQQRAHAGHARGANRRPRLLGRDTSERTSEAVSETGDRRHRSGLAENKPICDEQGAASPRFSTLRGAVAPT